MVAALLAAAVGCARDESAAAKQATTTLSIGFGENPEVGIRQAVTNIALEGLLRIDRDGRPSPWLADRWSAPPDGLTLHLHLRPGATFHNGQPASAVVVRDIIARDLPGYLGSVFDDVREIRASAPYELEFSLKRRSRFLLEGLDVLIEQGDESVVGTGPFSVVKKAPPSVEMEANAEYYAGKPLIDRIVFRSYGSVRAAWADMLRGRVDMLYEVGIDALDSLNASTQAKIFEFERPYAFVVILNMRTPKLRDKSLRQALNSAIDRASLVAEALDDRGMPADGPAWPYHWTYSDDTPRFRFEPHRLSDGSGAIQLGCILPADRSHERVALVIQRQLRAIGVELALEDMPSNQLLARLQSGDFEMLLVDARMGPSILQQYLFWYSKGPNNWGNFKSLEVDAAFDQIRGAPDDDAYKAGAAALQRALVNDPPAIFLAWGERLRAVSTRFQVHSEPGRDILSAPMLRLWRPVAGQQLTGPN